jgi:hypothetical protein
MARITSPRALTIKIKEKKKDGKEQLAGQTSHWALSGGASAPVSSPPGPPVPRLFLSWFKKKKKKPTTDLTLKKQANEWEGGKEIAAFWFYN